MQTQFTLVYVIYLEHYFEILYGSITVYNFNGEMLLSTSLIPESETTVDKCKINSRIRYVNVISRVAVDNIKCSWELVGKFIQVHCSLG